MMTTCLIAQSVQKDHKEPFLVEAVHVTGSMVIDGPLDEYEWDLSPVFTLSYLYLVFNNVHPFGDDLDLRPPGQQQAIFKVTYLHQL